MAIQGFFTGDVKIRELNGVLKAVNGIVEVATDAGTVTSVGLTVGSTGTDVNVANSPITTSGSITLNLPTASATNRGLLSSADWTTFNSKQSALTFSAPLVNTSGTISIPAATSSVNGYLTSTDWSTFNSKQGTLTLTTTGSSGAATLIGTTLNIPNYSGALTGYVPYTGATANLDLGTFDLTTDIINLNQLKAVGSGGLNIYSNSGTHIALLGGGGGAGVTFYGGIIGTTGSFTSSGSSDTFGITHSSGSGIALNITKGGNGEGLYINKTSGSGNAATIVGTLNATTLVKSGGTSSQFLKADGSVDSSTYYLASNPSAFIALTALSATAPLSYSNTTGVFSISQATTSTNGYLSSTDWNTFDSKQPAGSYITALTGEATASGPGSASVTLSTSAVTGKLLTGLNLTGGGTIAATDSILQAFGKVQNQISGIVGGVTFQGTWDASTNTPTLTSSVGTKGYYYIVSVAGSTNLNGITDWKIGDWAIFNGSTWDKVDNTDAVSSVNGFTGAVSLTTSNISEGTNLYYLDSRARLALSFTAGSGAYDNTTGVITIPTNTSQLTNGANFITLSSLSASSPLSYNSGTGAFSIQVANGSQNGYLSSTDWTTFNSKQNTITLTTTGSSGSSTLVGATLNVPTYTLSGLGGVPTSRQLTINGTAYDLSADRSWSVGTVTGSGTTGYVSKWSSSTAISNSLLYDNGSAVLLGTATAGSGKFMVYSTTADNHYQAVGSGPSFRFADTITSPTYTGIVALVTATNQFLTGSTAGDMVLANNTTSSIGNFLFGTGATERMRITPTGNVSINNTNNTYRFDVTGTVRFTGQLRLESTITDGTNTYTLPSATGTLALTSQIPANPVGGTGTTNYLPKFTGASTIGNSAITDDGTTVTLLSRALSGTSASFTSSVTAYGNAATSSAINSYNTIGGSGTAQHYQDFGNGAGFVAGRILRGNGASGLEANGLNIDTHTGFKVRLNQLGGSGGSFTIDGGNLGLGVTPSASADPAFQSRYGVFIGNDETNINNNAYFNSGWKYAQTGSFANRYYQNGYNGGHQWYTAPSGTAGNAISFTQAMTLDASGNLVVGDTTTSGRLRVVGNAATNGLTVKSAGNGGTFPFRVTWANGTDGSMFCVEDNGRVGIGTTSPTGRLMLYQSSAGNVFQNIVSNQGGSTQVGINFSPSMTDGEVAANPAQASIYATDSNFGANIIFANKTTGAVGNSLTERMRITSGGLVGIGTTSPLGKLDVYGGAANTESYIRTNSFDGTYYAALNFSTGGQGANDPQAQIRVVGENNYSANIRFYTQISGTSNPLAERMRITSGGTVLIGTTTEEFAGGKLQVAGAIRAAGQFTSVLSSSSFAYFDGSGQVVSSASSASALYLDTTWNTTGNPDGIYLNVANTASGASSKLLNLKVDNASQFSVSKAGEIKTSSPSSGSAQPWKLGSYAAGGTGTATGVIYIEVNGQIYSIPALLGTP
jgi:hypothetical protein